jgi:CDP-paratose 2-epimerase
VTVDKILVTGGAGFIGSNLVEHWLAKGSQVIAFDNLSRPGGGAKKNIDYLLGKYKGNPNFKFMQADVRDLNQLKKVMPDVDVVFHLAAQTAMTTSIEDPAEDFETNARGTFNVLEATRSSGADPVIIYTSTNKVYGDLTRRPVKLVEKEKRWDFADKEYFEGIDESYPLDFEGPYGCSKGVGDAYCLDYARTFGLRTVVFRMSGIYGMGQHSTEDQGWVAWFVRRATERKPIVIYGDGKQVRDILFITDLLDAFDRAVENIEAVRGQVYNIGGQRKNSISVLELLVLMERELGIRPSQISFDSWRRADQKVYISNTSRAREDLGWEARVDKEEGIKRLYEWMKKVVEVGQ